MARHIIVNLRVTDDEYPDENTHPDDVEALKEANAERAKVNPEQVEGWLRDCLNFTYAPPLEVDNVFEQEGE